MRVNPKLLFYGGISLINGIAHYKMAKPVWAAGLSPRSAYFEVLWTMLTLCLSSTRLRQLPPMELEDPEARTARYWNRIAARKRKRNYASKVCVGYERYVRADIGMYLV